MKNQKLAHRYAKALYEFAIDENQLEAIYKDITFLKKVFHDNKNLHIVIESPIITSDRKCIVFSELFEQKITPISLGFLNLIIKKKREPNLLDMFNEFSKLYYTFHNIRIAKFTTAVPVDQALIDHVRTLLEEQTKSSIELHQQVDETIIGGFIVNVEDFRVDASLLGKINKLKMEFLHNIYQPGF